MRKRILAAVAAFVLAITGLSFTATEAQARPVCEAWISNSPLKGRGGSSCVGLGTRQYQRVVLTCEGGRKAYGAWRKGGSTAICTVTGFRSLYASAQVATF